MRKERNSCRDLKMSSEDKPEPETVARSDEQPATLSAGSDVLFANLAAEPEAESEQSEDEGKLETLASWGDQPWPMPGTATRPDAPPGNLVADGDGDFWNCSSVAVGPEAEIIYCNKDDTCTPCPTFTAASDGVVTGSGAAVETMARSGSVSLITGTGIKFNKTDKSGSKSAETLGSTNITNGTCLDAKGGSVAQPSSQTASTASGVQRAGDEEMASRPGSGLNSRSTRVTSDSDRDKDPHSTLLSSTTHSAAYVDVLKTSGHHPQTYSKQLFLHSRAGNAVASVERTPLSESPTSLSEDADIESPVDSVDSIPVSECLTSLSEDSDIESPIDSADSTPSCQSPRDLNTDPPVSSSVVAGDGHLPEARAGLKLHSRKSESGSCVDRNNRFLCGKMTCSDETLTSISPTKPTHNAQSRETSSQGEGPFSVNRTAREGPFQMDMKTNKEAARSIIKDGSDCSQTPPARTGSQAACQQSHQASTCGINGVEKRDVKASVDTLNPQQLNTDEHVLQSLKEENQQLRSKESNRANTRISKIFPNQGIQQEPHWQYYHPNSSLDISTRQDNSSEGLKELQLTSQHQAVEPVQLQTGWKGTIQNRALKPLQLRACPTDTSKHQDLQPLQQFHRCLQTVSPTDANEKLLPSLQVKSIAQHQQPEQLQAYTLIHQRKQPFTHFEKIEEIINDDPIVGKKPKRPSSLHLVNVFRPGSPSRDTAGRVKEGSDGQSTDQQDMSSSSSPGQERGPEEADSQYQHLLQDLREPRRPERARLPVPTVRHFDDAVELPVEDSACCFVLFIALRNLLSAMASPVRREKRKAMDAADCLDVIQGELTDEVIVEQMGRLLSEGALDSLIQVLVCSNTPDHVHAATSLLEWATWARVRLNVKNVWPGLTESLGVLCVAMNEQHPAALMDRLRELMASALNVLVAGPGAADVSSIGTSFHQRHVTARLWLTLFDLCPRCHARTWRDLCRVLYILGKEDMAHFPGLGEYAELMVRWTLYHCYWGASSSLSRLCLARFLALIVQKDELFTILVQKENATLKALTELLLTATPPQRQLSSQSQPVSPTQQGPPRHSPSQQGPPRHSPSQQGPPRYPSTQLGSLRPGSRRRQLGSPSSPRQPASSASPSSPRQPASPASPSSPRQPASPSSPRQPASPSSPRQRASPASPSSPRQRASPASPSSPRQRASPASPSSPRQPASPWSPRQPASPASPSSPRQPASPASPSYPRQPASPSFPSSPRQPASASSSGQPVSPVDLQVTVCALKALAVLCERRPDFIKRQIVAQRHVERLFQGLVAVVTMRDLKESVQMDAAFVMRHFLCHREGRELMYKNYQPLIKVVFEYRTRKLGVILTYLMSKVVDLMTEKQRTNLVELLGFVSQLAANQQMGLNIVLNLMLKRKLKPTELQPHARTLWMTLVECQRTSERWRGRVLTALKALNAMYVALASEPNADYENYYRESLRMHAASNTEVVMRRVSYYKDCPDIDRKAGTAVYWLLRLRGKSLEWWEECVRPAAVMLSQLLKSRDEGVLLVGLAVLYLLLVEKCTRNLLEKLQEKKVVSCVQNLTQQDHTDLVVTRLVSLVNTLLQTAPRRDAPPQPDQEILAQCDKLFRQAPVDIIIRRTTHTPTDLSDLSVSMDHVQEREEVSRGELSSLITTIQAEGSLHATIRATRVKSSKTKPPVDVADVVKSLREGLAERDSYLDFGFRVICKPCLLGEVREEDDLDLRVRMYFTDLVRHITCELKWPDLWSRYPDVVARLRQYVEKEFGIVRRRVRFEGVEGSTVLSSEGGDRQRSPDDEPPTGSSRPPQATPQTCQSEGGSSRSEGESSQTPSQGQNVNPGRQAGERVEQAGFQDQLQGISTDVRSYVPNAAAQSVEGDQARTSQSILDNTENERHDERKDSEKWDEANNHPRPPTTWQSQQAQLARDLPQSAEQEPATSDSEDGEDSNKENIPPGESFKGRQTYGPVNPSHPQPVLQEMSISSFLLSEREELNSCSVTQPTNEFAVSLQSRLQQLSKIAHHHDSQDDGNLTPSDGIETDQSVDNTLSPLWETLNSSCELSARPAQHSVNSEQDSGSNDQDSLNNDQAQLGSSQSVGDGNDTSIETDEEFFNSDLDHVGEESQEELAEGGVDFGIYQGGRNRKYNLLYESLVAHDGSCMSSDFDITVDQSAEFTSQGLSTESGDSLMDMSSHTSDDDVFLQSCDAQTMAATHEQVQSEPVKDNNEDEQMRAHCFTDSVRAEDSTRLFTRNRNPRALSVPAPASVRQGEQAANQTPSCRSSSQVYLNTEDKKVGQGHAGHPYSPSETSPLLQALLPETAPPFKTETQDMTTRKSVLTSEKKCAENNGGSEAENKELLEMRITDENGTQMTSATLVDNKKINDNNQEADSIRAESSILGDFLISTRSSDNVYCARTNAALSDGIRTPDHSQEPDDKQQYRKRANTIPPAQKYMVTRTIQETVAEFLQEPNCNEWMESATEKERDSPTSCSVSSYQTSSPIAADCDQSGRGWKEMEHIEDTEDDHRVAHGQETGHQSEVSVATVCSVGHAPLLGQPAQSADMPEVTPHAHQEAAVVSSQNKGKVDHKNMKSVEVFSTKETVLSSDSKRTKNHGDMEHQSLGAQEVALASGCQSRYEASNDEVLALSLEMLAEHLSNELLSPMQQDALKFDSVCPQSEEERRESVTVVLEIGDDTLEDLMQAVDTGDDVDDEDGGGEELALPPWGSQQLNSFDTEEGVLRSPRVPREVSMNSGQLHPYFSDHPMKSFGDVEKCVAQLGEALPGNVKHSEVYLRTNNGVTGPDRQQEVVADIERGESVHLKTNRKDRYATGSAWLPLSTQDPSQHATDQDEGTDSRDSAVGDLQIDSSSLKDVEINNILTNVQMTCNTEDARPTMSESPEVVTSKTTEKPQNKRRKPEGGKRRRRKESGSLKENSDPTMGSATVSFSAAGDLDVSSNQPSDSLHEKYEKTVPSEARPRSQDEGEGRQTHCMESRADHRLLTSSTLQGTGRVAACPAVNGQDESCLQLLVQAKEKLPPSKDNREVTYATLRSENGDQKHIASEPSDSASATRRPSRGTSRTTREQSKHTPVLDTFEQKHLSSLKTENMTDSLISKTKGPRPTVGSSSGKVQGKDSGPHARKTLEKQALSSDASDKHISSKRSENQFHAFEPSTYEAENTKDNSTAETKTKGSMFKPPSALAVPKRRCKSLSTLETTKKSRQGRRAAQLRKKRGASVRSLTDSSQGSVSSDLSSCQETSFPCDTRHVFPKPISPSSGASVGRTSSETLHDSSHRQSGRSLQKADPHYHSQSKVCMEENVLCDLLEPRQETQRLKGSDDVQDKCSLFLDKHLTTDDAGKESQLEIDKTSSQDDVPKNVSQCKRSKPESQTQEEDDESALSLDESALSLDESALSLSEFLVRDDAWRGRHPQRSRYVMWDRSDPPRRWSRVCSNYRPRQTGIRTPSRPRYSSLMAMQAGTDRTLQDVSRGVEVEGGCGGSGITSAKSRWGGGPLSNGRLNTDGLNSWNGLDSGGHDARSHVIPADCTMRSYGGTLVPAVSASFDEDMAHVLASCTDQRYAPALHSDLDDPATRAKSTRVHQGTHHSQPDTADRQSRPLRLSSGESRARHELLAKRRRKSDRDSGSEGVSGDKSYSSGCQSLDDGTDQDTPTSAGIPCKSRKMVLSLKNGDDWECIPSPQRQDGSSHTPSKTVRRKPLVSVRRDLESGELIAYSLVKSKLPKKKSTFQFHWKKKAQQPESSSDTGCASSDVTCNTSTTTTGDDPRIAERAVARKSKSTHSPLYRLRHAFRQETRKKLDITVDKPSPRERKAVDTSVAKHTDLVEADSEDSGADPQTADSSKVLVRVDSSRSVWKQKLLDCMWSDERKRSEQDLSFLVLPTDKSDSDLDPSDKLHDSSEHSEPQWSASSHHNQARVVGDTTCRFAQNDVSVPPVKPPRLHIVSSPPKLVSVQRGLSNPVVPKSDCGSDTRLGEPAAIGSDARLEETAAISVEFSNPLPKQLSNPKCSLNTNVEDPVLVSEEYGNIVSENVFRSESSIDLDDILREDSTNFKQEKQISTSRKSRKKVIPKLDPKATTATHLSETKSSKSSPKTMQFSTISLNTPKTSQNSPQTSDPLKQHERTVKTHTQTTPLSRSSGSWKVLESRGGYDPERQQSEEDPTMDCEGSSVSTKVSRDDVGRGKVQFLGKLFHKGRQGKTKK